MPEGEWWDRPGIKEYAPYVGTMLATIAVISHNEILEDSIVLPMLPTSIQPNAVGQWFLELSYNTTLHWNACLKNLFEITDSKTKEIFNNNKVSVKEISLPWGTQPQRKL